MVAGLARGIAVFIVGMALAAGMATTVNAQVPDVQVFAPGYYSTAELDEPVRFSWFAQNSQDFFRILFNRYRSFGWETSPYASRQTVLSSLYLSPREAGLTPGTWYWRVCFGWNDTPGTCYVDDEIRTLHVTEPPPFLTLASARSVAQRYARRTWGVRARAWCRRLSDSQATCRVTWRRKRRTLVRYLGLELRTDGYVYVSRG